MSTIQEDKHSIDPSFRPFETTTQVSKGTIERELEFQCRRVMSDMLRNQVRLPPETQRAISERPWDFVTEAGQ